MTPVAKESEHSIAYFREWAIPTSGKMDAYLA